MAAYVFATVRHVTNRQGLEDYWRHVGPTFAGTGAKPLAAYTPFTMLEGTGPVEGVVAIEFPDMQSARQWYESVGYQAAKKYREGAADIELILVEGGAVSAPELRMPHID
jgi:uncharacterized protein (DUF1330 family)